jgi:hypothetical protein
MDLAQVPLDWTRNLTHGCGLFRAARWALDPQRQ